MYTPYGNVPQNLQHPQPQHVGAQAAQQAYQQPPAAQYQQSAQYQQYGQPNQYAQTTGQYAQPAGQFGQPAGQPQGQSSYNFLNDPAASMAAQFAKSSFGSSNQYIQQNFGSFIPGTSNLKYYFKVSNTYVYRKIRLILFPYRNQNWSRLTTTGLGASGVASPGTEPSQLTYAPPVLDVNAPDLYIPLMAYITYILLWLVFQGLQGDFHPQLFGYLASQTLACSFLDILIFKVGLYLLNCSTQTSLWDLVAFSGYKYVSIIAILCWKHVIGGSWYVYYLVLFVVTANLSLFLMRSLKFMVLPSADAVGSSNTISSKQRRIRIQFLFVYSAAVQFLIIIFMSK